MGRAVAIISADSFFEAPLREALNKSFDKLRTSGIHLFRASLGAQVFRIFYFLLSPALFSDTRR
jgi:hypothetical protein